MLTNPNLDWLLEAAKLCIDRRADTRPRARDLIARVSPDWNIQVELLTNAGWNPDRHGKVIGRKFVRDKFESFAKSCKNHSGVFVVEGPPGIGKSALLTDWQNRLGSPAGFYFRYLEGTSTAPELMAEKIEQQLLRQFPPEATPDRRYSEHVHQDSTLGLGDREDFGERGRRLPRILEHISKRLGPNERLILFVDALDEASNPVKAADLIPLNPPRGIFFIVSTRPPVADGSLESRVKNAGGVYFQFDPTGPDNTNDLVDFFNDRLAGRLTPSEKRELTKATDGSFLLATLFVEGILEDTHKVADLINLGARWDRLQRQLPDKPGTTFRLYDFYDITWKRITEPADRDKATDKEKDNKTEDKTCLSEFACLLSATIGPVLPRSAKDLLSFFEDNVQNRTPRLWKAVNRLNHTVRLLRWLLEERKECYQGAETRAFLIRHQSVREWLIAEGGPAFEGLSDMHFALADYYLTQRYGWTLREVHKKIDGPLTLAEYQRHQRGIKDWSLLDTYGRFHLPTHLLKASRRELAQLACELLTSPEFLQATLGDEPSGLVL